MCFLKKLLKPLLETTITKGLREFPKQTDTRNASFTKFISRTDQLLPPFDSLIRHSAHPSVTNPRKTATVVRRQLAVFQRRRWPDITRGCGADRHGPLCFLQGTPSVQPRRSSRKVTTTCPTCSLRSRMLICGDAPDITRRISRAGYRASALFVRIVGSAWSPARCVRAPSARSACVTRSCSWSSPTASPSRMRKYSPEGLTQSCPATAHQATTLGHRASGCCRGRRGRRRTGRRPGSGARCWG